MLKLNQPLVERIENLQHRLTKVGRFNLSQWPTPLHPANRLGTILSLDLWLKRDDLTDPGLGGNKVRKLEFLMADALAKGAKAVITSGGTQSNHARITAAVAARLGLECHLVLRGPDSGERRGNLALDELFGAKLHWRQVERVPELGPLAEELAVELTAQGEKVYLIPVGGAAALGELGYVEFMSELHWQLAEVDRDPAKVRLVCAVGSRGTMAGLVAGKRILDSPIRLTGISVSRPTDFLLEQIPILANEATALLGYPADCSTNEFEIIEGYIGQAYAIPTLEGWQAIRLAGRSEGIVLDPVYTGKAMAGLIGSVQNGLIAPGETVVFLHTGGSPAFFAFDAPDWNKLD